MNKFVTFIFGLGIGSTATYFLTQKIIQSKANEEIESVVKTFHERYEKLTDILSEDQKKELGVFSPSKQMKKDIEKKMEDFKESYKEQMDDLGYSVGVDSSETQDQNTESIIKVETDNVFKAPYVITEDEFGEFGNEEKVLTLYADNILADEDEEIIDDPETILGSCLEDFDDYDKVMYVRNENIETDYTIWKSDKLFKDLAPEVND